MRHNGVLAGRLDRRWFLALLAVAPCLVAFGAAAPGNAAACRRFYIAGHVRHASIIIDRRDFDPARSIDSPEFADKEWLEFGWGDADFYQANGENILLGLKALLWPTAAVMHVYGFDGTPKAAFPASEVLALDLTPAGYARLIAFLKAAFTRDAAGHVKRLGPGLYGLSFFYAGEGTYDAFHTCNTWTAEALAAGGFPIDPAEVGTLRQFMTRIRGKTHAACRAGAA